mmetsp:Transcript_97486/g.271196  ORF Transcript_97486/g.271196 Transcript_97486/m.271196 type:complete len:377 (+) Transcript_97486:55-1185(+)
MVLLHGVGHHDMHLGGWASITSYVLLFILKVSLAASIDTSEFGKRVTRRWPILFGVVCQFVVSPICGALSVWLLGIQFIPGVLLLVVTSCPGGCFSNWLCQLVNGDLAMSVAMTGCSTLIGMVLLPTNICFYTRLIYSKQVLSDRQWSGIATSVAMVLGALFVGLTISKHLDCQRWRQRFSHVGTVCGLLLFAFSAFESVNPDRTTVPLWRRHAKFYLSVALPVVMTTTIMVVLTSSAHFRLKPPERVAVVIEAVYQNTALAATMAIQMFPGRHMGDAMGIVVLYQLCQGIILTLFGIGAHYSNWTLASPSETSLFSALTGNFQQRAAGSLLLVSQAKAAACEYSSALPPAAGLVKPRASGVGGKQHEASSEGHLL